MFYPKYNFFLFISKKISDESWFVFHPENEIDGFSDQSGRRLHHFRQGSFQDLVAVTRIDVTVRSIRGTLR